MKTKMIRILLALLLILSVLPASAQTAIPARILGTETNIGGGLWQYDYTVYNDLDAVAFPNYTLYDVTYQYDPIANLTVDALPNRWSDLPDFGQIETLATDVGAPPLGSEIIPGASLSGFRFTFDYQAGSLPFTALFTNPNDLSNPIVYNGFTTLIAASGVPEPGAFGLLVGSLSCGAFVVRRRRK